MNHDRWFEPRTYKIIWYSVLPLVSAALAFAVAFWGLDVLLKPVPGVPTLAARYWLTTNTALYFAGMVLDLRNLLRYEEAWTWQERMVSRGIFFIFGGSTLGLIPRAFGDSAVVTLGTPVVSIGLILFIYGVVSPPVRFDPDRQEKP